MELKQADRIAEALEDMVLTGHFQQGQRLDETGLAKHFGVSRTPVREALQCLVKSELATQIPRRGVFVKHPSSITLIEMFETMAEIEAVCTRLAADRLTPQALDLLICVNVMCQDTFAAQDTGRYSQHNQEFHHMLYRMTGNAFLEKQAVRLFRLLKPFRRVQLQTPGRMKASLNEHTLIIDALQSGHGLDAARIARDHVSGQGQRFYNQMAQLKLAPALRVAI